jgi:alanine-glyoxylate transaminase/serine-glyoxylate transaminase/serine-pyruvate transaminase
MTGMAGDDAAERLPLGPGPSPLHPRVREALSRPVMGHLDPIFLDILDEVSDLLRQVFRTEGLSFAVSGSGSAGMEAAMVNLVEPGDRAIVGVAGFFAERMAEMGRRARAEVVPVEAPWGRAVNPADVERAMDEYPDVKVVALVHAETSTGVGQPLEEVAALCRDRDVLFVVDAVASLGGMPLDVDELGIDVCFSGSQKCLSVAPGVAPICFSPNALAAVESRETPVQSWYLDVTGIRKYVGTERRYHHTAPINMVYGLKEGLQIVLEEGLEARWKRHEEVGRAFQDALEDLGFELFAEKAVRLPHITSALIPEGVDDKVARGRLLDEHGIEIAGGLGEYAGRMWRVGLMGEGARKDHADRLLEAIRAVIA